MSDYTCWSCGERLVDEGEGFWKCPQCKMSYHTRYSQMGEPDSAEQRRVDNAAQNCASHGKDSDHTFGYSEDELEEAL